MIMRVLWAAILAGLLAGVVVSVVQAVKVTPLIHQAETFEVTAGDSTEGTFPGLIRAHDRRKFSFTEGFSGEVCAGIGEDDGNCHQRYQCGAVFKTYVQQNDVCREPANVDHTKNR